MKVGIVGAGNVGSMLACRIVEENMAEVVLLDIIEGVAKGKAEDINDSTSIKKTTKRVFGTSNYNHLKGSSLIVITAGLVRQPGMTREELLKTNHATIKEVSKKILYNCRNPIIIMVTNPLDIMTYTFIKETGFSKKKVFGMAGTLDCGRLVNAISTTLRALPSKINPAIIGPHNEDMIILERFTKVSGNPITSIIDKDRLAQIARLTKERGAFIVSLLKKGSAYFAPSQAIFLMVKAIVTKSPKKIYASCYLDGEYGLRDVCIGVPAILGKNGIERIIELPLNKTEMDLLFNSATKLKKIVDSLYPNV